MDKKIDKRTAMKRAVAMHQQATRDKETAISAAEKQEAQKRVDHWHGIIQKVSHMLEQKSFSTFVGQLCEDIGSDLSQKTDSALRYIALSGWPKEKRAAAQAEINKRKRNKNK